MVLPKPVFFHSRTVRLSPLSDFCKKHCMEFLLGTHVSVSWPYIHIQGKLLGQEGSALVHLVRKEFSKAS